MTACMQTAGIRIGIGGQWLEPGDKEFEVSVERSPGEGGTVAKARFTNRSGKAIRFDGFRFDLQAMPGTPGERLRLYREGWTMASACASVRFGEKDFEVDPGYMKFAVSDPESYSSETPNRFSAEHVVVLNDRDTGYSELAGFITSANQMTRFIVELSASGVKALAAYSCADGMVVDPGETVASEELLLLSGQDGYGLLQKFADIWGKRMNALTWGHVPTGWCSWYYYFSNVTENDMLENIRFLAENKTEYPMEFIQLDDGYQAALGDWLDCNEKFPRGLAFLAGEVRKAGFKPGLWLAPFMVEECSRLYADHPDWMVRDGEGHTRWVSEWRGSRVAVLDGTHPQAQAYLTTVFAKLVEWGFEYVKIDFLVWATMGRGGEYHDPKATRAQALRRGLEAIRKGMGDRFILGCTAPLGQAVGLVNGNRVGTDIAPRWQPDRKVYKEAPTVPNVCRNIINRAYMNGKLWVSDPDTHIARTDNNELTENEVLLWTYALYQVGGMMLLSDRFSTLTPERAALSKMLLAAPGIPDTRPLDFLEREYPAVWFRRDAKTGETTLGLFNFENGRKELRVDWKQAGIGCPDFLTDKMTGKPLPLSASGLTVELEPHSCRIFQLK